MHVLRWFPNKPYLSPVSCFNLNAMKYKLLQLLPLVLALVTGRAAAAGDLSATATESYQIQNKKFGDLLRPKDASNAEGARLVLYPAQSWKCMTWKLHPAGEASFQLQNHFTSKTFVVKSTEGVSNVVQTAFAKETKDRPMWKFTKLPDGSYQISDAKSGQVLTAISSERGVSIVVAPWQDKDEQKWLLQKTDPATLTM